uniref:Uncharacterized protein n=1 Tax=Anguilla anguilla TaxID=7936 RepID=A0A0E9V3I7_ANGAN
MRKKHDSKYNLLVYFYIFTI